MRPGTKLEPNRPGEGRNHGTIAAAVLLILLAGAACWEDAWGGHLRRTISGPDRLNAVEIAAFAGPIALGSGPVRVTLTDSEALGRHGLAAHVTSLAPGRHIYLVLRELHAEEQPGVLFHVYLDLAEGAKPGKNDAHHVGALNFFGATQLRDAEKANAGERAFRSYDITALARKLQAQKLLSEQTTVTILPGAAPAANAHAQIGRIEVVEQ